MENISIFVKVAFILITLLTIYQFYRATNKSSVFLVGICVWVTTQMLIGSTDFYTDASTVPPRFALMVVPPLLLTIILFSLPKGRVFIDNLNIKQLTLLHAIRVPVEIVLYFLFIQKAIPEIMTFEGRNFDIFAGIFALLVYYFVFKENENTSQIPQKAKLALIIWNLVSLCLLLNIVVLAILSAKTPFQQFGFEQPNIAVAYFPFNWLPSVVVPLVLFSHLVSLRQLLFQSKNVIITNNITKNIIAISLIILVLTSCNNSTKTPNLTNMSNQPSSQTNNEKLVKKYFEHFNKHEWTKMASLYSEIADFKDPTLGKGIVKQTRQQIIDKYSALNKVFPDLHDEVIKTYVSGENHIIIEFVSTGTAPDNTKFELPICAIMTIENGLITKDFSYFDNFEEGK